jgi:hypothetical protein
MLSIVLELRGLTSEKMRGWATFSLALPVADCGLYPSLRLALGYQCPIPPTRPISFAVRV